MTLPATVDAGLSWSDFENARHGPWEYGGNLYGVFVDKTNNSIEIWKSTDGGNTWSEVDAANHKSIWTTTGSRTASGSFDGTRIYIGCSSNANVNASIEIFNCSTDTWQTVSASYQPWGTAGTRADNTYAYQALKRSDGSIVLIMQGGTNGVMGTNYRTVRYRITSTTQDGTYQNAATIAFGSVAAHFDYLDAVIDANDRVYIFAQDATNGDLSVVTINSANTLSAAAIDVDDTAFNSGYYTAGHSVIVDDATDQVAIPYIETTGALTLAYANVADSPTFIVRTIAGSYIQDLLAASGSLSNFGQSTALLKRAQSFIPASNSSLGFVSSRVNKAGSPTYNVTATLQSDSGGKPSGTVLATSTNTVDSASLPSGAAPLYPTATWHFSGASLSASTKYWIVFDGPVSADASNYLIFISGSLVTGIGSASWDGSVWSAETATDLAILVGDSYTPEILTGNPGSLALDSTTIYAFWPNVAGDTIYRDSGTTGSGFGADTAWSSSITSANAVSIGKVTSAIGVFYDENGTVKYNAYSLLPPGKAFAPVRFHLLRNNVLLRL